MQKWASHLITPHLIFYIRKWSVPSFKECFKTQTEMLLTFSIYLYLAIWELTAITDWNIKSSTIRKINSCIRLKNKEEICTLLQLVSCSGKSIFISLTLLNRRIKKASKHLLQPNYFGTIEPYEVHRIKRTPCWKQLFNAVAVGSMYKLDCIGRRPKQNIMKKLIWIVLDITHNCKKKTTGFTFFMKCPITNIGRCHKIHIPFICITDILR